MKMNFQTTDWALKRRKGVKMKKLTMLLSTILGVSVLFMGCGDPKVSDGNPGAAVETFELEESASESKTLEKITMYGVPDPQISAAQVIAKVNGYYEEQGLDVENVLVANSPEVGPILGSNQAQIAFAGSYAVMTWVNSDIPIKIVTPVCDIGGTQDTCIRGDLNITAAKDLEGLNVGCTPGSESEIILQKMCDDLGVDHSSLNIIPLQGADMLSSLESGDIDIMAAHEPWITKAENQYGAKFLMSGTQSAIPGSDPDSHWLSVYSTIVVNDDYAQEHPETIIKIITAIEKATDFINNNREDAVKILSKEFGIDENDLTTIMSRNDYTMGVTEDYIYWSNWLADYIHSKDIIQKELKIEDYNDFEILKSNFPELYKVEE